MDGVRIPTKGVQRGLLDAVEEPKVRSLPGALPRQSPGILAGMLVGQEPHPGQLYTSNVLTPGCSKYSRQYSLSICFWMN